MTRDVWGAARLSMLLVSYIFIFYPANYLWTFLFHYNNAIAFFTYNNIISGHNFVNFIWMLLFQLIFICSTTFFMWLVNFVFDKKKNIYISSRIIPQYSRILINNQWYYLFNLCYVFVVGIAVFVLFIGSMFVYLVDLFHYLLNFFSHRKHPNNIIINNKNTKRREQWLKCDYFFLFFIFVQRSFFLSYAEFNIHPKILSLTL